MAVNTNKRIPVKHIRDRAKSAYDKQDTCHICGSTEDLELHHTSSLTLLLEKWVKEKGYDISTDEAVIAIRDEFIDDHRSEIYDEVFTLCNKHHVKLHGIFGKAPLLSSAAKQNRWIEKQKAKALGLDAEKSAGAFSKFY
jgi:5-methylcytosine-specific restriction endonuclease McrA